MKSTFIFLLEKIRKARWLLHWILFSLIVCSFLIMAIYYRDENWIGNVLQTIGIVIGIYLTLIIFLQSKEESEGQFRDQIKFLQSFNAKQIEAIQLATEKQILALQELTNKQIAALQDTTEKQIEIIQKSTFDEISSFEQQIREVTSKLSDNSILLAEILGRELEKSISALNDTLIKEQLKYRDLSEWKLLRTQEEKEQQLNHQSNRIERIRQVFNYLIDKYNQVTKFLGFENRILKE